jgi:hypothetical protein
LFFWLRFVNFIGTSLAQSIVSTSNTDSSVARAVLALIIFTLHTLFDYLN